MGALFLRMPKNAQHPEHWQLISNNLSGPAPEGQLKLLTYDGWARHVPNADHDADLLKLRDRKGKDWINLLWMTTEGQLAQEVWYVVRSSSHPGSRMLGPTMAYGTTEGYVDQQFSSVTYLNAANQQITFEPGEGDLRAYFSRGIVLNHGIPTSSDQGYNNQGFSNSFDRPSSLPLQAFSYRTRFRHDGSQGSATAIPMEYYPAGTQYTEYQHGYLHIDIDYVMRNTAVPAASITGMAIRFKGTALSIVNDAFNQEGVIGSVPGIILGAPVTGTGPVCYIDDVTGQLPLKSTGVIQGLSTEYGPALGQTPDGHIKEVHLPMRTPESQNVLPTQQIYNNMHNLFAYDHLATAQGAVWEGAYTGAGSPPTGVPVEYVQLLSTADIESARTTGKDFAMYTDPMPDTWTIPDNATPDDPFFAYGGGCSVRVWTHFDDVSVEILTAG